MKCKLASQLSAKRKRDELEDALSTLAACQLSTVHQLEDKRAVEVILAVKFEHDTRTALSYIAQHLPTQLPGE